MSYVFTAVKLEVLKSKMKASNFLAAVKKLAVREDGPTMTEYGIMVALIAVVCIATVTTLGTQIQAVFTNITNKLGPLAG